MSENNKIKKCDEKEKTILKMICDVEKLYKDDFDTWKKCYRSLVDAVFKENEENSPTCYVINKTKLESLKKDLKNYPLFENLKENTNVFSFMVMLNKYGEKSRREIAKKILKNKECSTDFLGVPAGQQGISAKSFEMISVENSKLNQIAYTLIHSNDISEEDLKIVEKLTDTFKNVFYILAPEKYYPSDSNTRAFLKKIGKDGDEPLSIEITEGDYFSRAVSFLAPMEKNQIDNILDKFIDKDENKPKNIILTGIPGTGKTYAVMKYLEDNGYIDKKNPQNNRYAFVQFHPSYDYEDFIEGLKPIPKDGQIEFKLVNGVFKELCKKAYEDKENTYVMVIDEINRANLSRVFGELLYCLEYRDEFVSTKMTTYIESLENKEDYSVSTENIGKFAIPNNVIILGTMNEVDRSIDAFDLALRRRFIWEEIGFSENALRLYTPFFTKNFQRNIKKLVENAKILNKELTKDIGINYQLGHTYYFKIIDYFAGDFDSALCDLWEYHLKSIIKEYCKVKFSQNEIEDKLLVYKKIIVGDKNCND